MNISRFLIKSIDIKFSAQIFHSGQQKKFIFRNAYIVKFSETHTLLTIKKLFFSIKTFIFI